MQRWSLDFVSDQLADCRRFRVLNIVDDHSRFCPGQIVDVSISGARVARYLDDLALLHGLPEEIVLYNGPEGTSRAMFDGSERTGVPAALHPVSSRGPAVAGSRPAPGRRRRRPVARVGAEGCRHAADLRRLVGGGDERARRLGNLLGRLATQRLEPHVEPADRADAGGGGRREGGDGGAGDGGELRPELCRGWRRAAARGSGARPRGRARDHHAAVRRQRAPEDAEAGNGDHLADAIGFREGRLDVPHDLAGAVERRRLGSWISRKSGAWSSSGRKVEGSTVKSTAAPTKLAASSPSATSGTPPLRSRRTGHRSRAASRARARTSRAGRGGSPASAAAASPRESAGLSVERDDRRQTTSAADRVTANCRCRVGR